MPKSDLLIFETSIFTKLLFALIKLFSGISEKSLVPFGLSVGFALGASVGISVSGASVSFAPSVGAAVTAAVGSEVGAFAVGEQDFLLRQHDFQVGGQAGAKLDFGHRAVHAVHDEGVAVAVKGAVRRKERQTDA